MDLIDRFVKAAIDLSPGSEGRKHVAREDFVYKNKSPRGETKETARGSYPVPDVAHARAALGFAAMHHGKDSATYRAVQAKVRAKFPDMGKRGADDAGTPYPGTQQLGLQSYLPVGRKRDLTPEEEEDVARGQERWLPRIFQSYGTPLPEMMSSPAKGGLLGVGLGGVGGAGLGGLLGAAIGSKLQRAGAVDNGEALLAALGILGGGTLGAGLGGITGYFGRQATNEGLVDMMRRLPSGATRRDYLADPVVQADHERLNRLAVANAYGGSRAGMMAAMMAR